jgi:hypothetical protein
MARDTKPKGSIVHVRLSEDELTVLDQRADALGLKRSDYARRVLAGTALQSVKASHSGLLPDESAVARDSVTTIVARARPYTDPKTCKHPIARRMKGTTFCHECGTDVKKGS